MSLPRALVKTRLVLLLRALAEIPIAGKGILGLGGVLVVPQGVIAMSVREVQEVLPPLKPVMEAMDARPGARPRRPLLSWRHSGGNRYLKRSGIIECLLGGRVSSGGGGGGGLGREGWLYRES